MAAELDKTDLQNIKDIAGEWKDNQPPAFERIGLSPAPTLSVCASLKNAEYIKSYHALVDEEEAWLRYKNLHPDIARFSSEKYYPELFG